MKKQREIPLTNHFNLDPETFFGKITLYKEIPAGAIVTFGYEIIENKDGSKKLSVTEAAIIPQKHFKNYLDALPESCTSAGGHVKGKGKRCQLCGGIV